LHHLLSLEALVAFLTLTALEIVLGIDNIVLLAILSGKLDPAVQDRGRRIGLALAMIMRIALLLTIGWFMRLSEPLVWLAQHPFSLRDFIMLAGGVFLIGKATAELHEQVENKKRKASPAGGSVVFHVVIFQIVAMDIVFSLDSVLTAIGMARHLEVMMLAIVAAVVVMLVFAGVVSRFINQHPTIKVLALSFVMLIGVVLVADGLGRHVERAYIYFAMGFSLVVELLNMRARKVAREARTQ
jgi:predicted tellurium resistance membrane protein TerC